MGPRCRRAGQLLGRGRPNLRGPGTAAPCPTELRHPRTRTGHRLIGGCGRMAGPGPRVTASKVQAGPEPGEGPRPHSPSASALTGRGAPLAPINLTAERASCFSGERQLGLKVSPSLGVRQRHQGRPLPRRTGRPALAVARGSVSVRHPEVPQPGLLRSSEHPRGRGGAVGREGRGPSGALGHRGRRGRRPRTHPAGSALSGAPTRRIMPPAAPGR